MDYKQLRGEARNILKDRERSGCFESPYEGEYLRCILDELHKHTQEKQIQNLVYVMYEVHHTYGTKQSYKKLMDWNNLCIQMTGVNKIESMRNGGKINNYLEDPYCKVNVKDCKVCAHARTLVN